MNSKGYNIILFKADPIRGGDLGNYWHYLFGFLIPASYWLWKNPVLWKGKSIKVDACNPLTDNLMKEYLDHLQIPYVFEELTEKTIQMTRKDWKSYRGKIWRKLSAWERLVRGEQSKWFTYHHLRLRKNILSLPRWDRYLEQYGDFPLFFRNDLDSYRNFFRNQITFPNDQLQNKTDWLIIKRSPPPKALDQEKGKNARWFEGYGTERRELKGIDEAVDQLLNLGYTVKTSATGELGLFQQVKIFADSKYIIGVRGAEFANIFWMDKGSEVYLFMSASFQNDSIQRKLAAACSLSYLELPHEGAISPSLDVSKIIQAKKPLNSNFSHAPQPYI